MQSFNDRRLITPPKEEDDIYPYRRVWRSIAVESGILIGIVGVLFVSRNFLGIQLPEALRPGMNVALALLPMLLWLLISRFAENFALQPRRRLFTVFIVSALVANAIGLPFLEDFVQPEAWLPLQEATTRIIGYTATVGIVGEFLKYLVLRLLVWPDEYRIRVDSVAYGVASAIGFSLVISLSYVANNPNAFNDVVGIRILGITLSHLVGSTIIAYGLSATFFNNAFAILLPFMLFLASGFVGLSTALRTSFANTPLAVGSISAPRFLFGIAFSVASYVGLMMIFFFLFEVADRRDRNNMGNEEL